MLETCTSLGPRGLIVLAQTALSGSTPPEWADLENAWVVVLVYLGLAAAGLLVDGALIVRFLVHPVNWRRNTKHLDLRAWDLGETVQLAILLVLLHALCTVAYGLILKAAGDATSDVTPVAVIMQSVVFHWAALALVVSTMRRRGMRWGTSFGISRTRLLKGIGQGVLFYLGAMPFFLFSSWIYGVLLQWAGKTPHVQDVAWVVTGDSSLAVRVYLLTLTILIAPVAEEILFRGIVLPVLARRIGVVGGILVTSAVFAAIHFHVPSLVPLFVIAASFSLAYVLSESIVVPITMHVLFNGVALGVLSILRNM